MAVRPGESPTFLLLHGAGSDAWYWHRVTPALEAAGHSTVCPDLPVDDDACGLEAYADAAVQAAATRGPLIVVAQSMAAFVAPLLVERLPVEMIVLVAAMVPAPGETPGEWWANTGQADAARRWAQEEGRDPDAPFDPFEIFLHDVPVELHAESGVHVRTQSDRPFSDRCPMVAWPEVPTRAVVGARDRLFPRELQIRVTRERLALDPDEIDSGHLPALARPAELSALLLRYRAELGAAAPGS